MEERVNKIKIFSIIKFAMILAPCGYLLFRAGFSNFLVVFIPFTLFVISLVADYAAMKRDRVYDGTPIEREILQSLKATLSDEIGVKLDLLHLAVMPSQEVKIRSYGRTIAVSTAALDSGFDSLLGGVGCQLVAAISGSSIRHRLVFLGAIATMLSLTLMSWSLLILVWILFFILCSFRLCGGVISFFFMHQTTKAIRGGTSMLGRAFVFLYKAICGFLNRRSTFEGDRFCVQAGLRNELCSYLASLPEEDYQLGFRDLLYEYTPPVAHRLDKIHQAASESEINTSQRY